MVESRLPFWARGLNRTYLGGQLATCHQSSSMPIMWASVATRRFRTCGYYFLFRLTKERLRCQPRLSGRTYNARVHCNIAVPPGSTSPPLNSLSSGLVYDSISLSSSPAPHQTNKMPFAPADMYSATIVDYEPESRFESRSSTLCVHSLWSVITI
jgi:hypothetical protein